MDRRERPPVAVGLAALALAAVAAYVVGVAQSWSSVPVRARETDRAPEAPVRAERLREAARRALRGEPGTVPAAGLEPLPLDAELDRR